MKYRFQNGTGVGLECKSPDRIDQVRDRAIPSDYQRVKKPRLGLDPGFPRSSRPIGLEGAFSKASEQQS